VPTAAAADPSAAVTAPTRTPSRAPSALPLPPPPRATSTAPTEPDPRRRLVRVDTDPGSIHLDVRGVRAPLVGRGPALTVLRDVVGRAVDFQAPQLVTVVGNQGTGKSRLIAELVAGIKPPIRVFHGRAKADGERYAVVASLLRDRFQLAPGDVDAVARQRFAAEIKDVMGDGQVVEVLHFLGSFVGIDFAPSPFLKVLSESPRQHDEIARTVLRRFLEVDAQASPLVLVLDDLQWADDATLTLISELASGLGGSSVVILASTRPEMLVRSPGWGQGAVDHERVDLRNLEPDDAEAMFRHLLARCGPIPDDIADAAVEMTGGNPAFLEQLVRLFLADGTIDASGPTWVLDVERAAAAELPISVEEAIEARIAALERDERELLEKAAVFGNVFWLSAVVALTRLENDEHPVGNPLEYEWTDGDRTGRRIRDLVYALGEQDYLLALDATDSTMPGDVEIVFKHNLERELIVKSTEAGRRARYHLTAAQWLEARLSGRSEEQLEALAGLYERGGDNRRAARCYLAGGDRARARYAHDEARTLYERGLAMLGDDEAPTRMDALHNLGDVLDLAGRTEEALARFADMLTLAWRYDNQGKAGAAHSRLARVHRRHGHYDPAMEHLRRAHDLFSRVADDRGIASTLDDMGKVHWLRGAYSQALEFHRQALTIRRALGERRSIALSLANIGRVHHDSGNFKAAIAQFREALDLRRDIGDLAGCVQSLCDLGGVHSEDGNHPLALELLGEARAMATEIGDRAAMADVLSRTGECKAAMGRGREAVADLIQARDLAKVTGDRVALSEAHRRLAEVQATLGELAAATEDAYAAITISESVGSRVHVGCGHRVMAEILAASGKAPSAEDHFRTAVDILSAMKNELELARTLRAFATFRNAAGGGPEADRLRQKADEIYARLRGAAATD
jgi:tetratricopeptide (TPR) repeat protein